MQTFGIYGISSFTKYERIVFNIIIVALHVIAKTICAQQESFSPGL